MTWFLIITMAFASQGNVTQDTRTVEMGSEAVCARVAHQMAREISKKADPAYRNVVGYKLECAATER